MIENLSAIKNHRIKFARFTSNVVKSGCTNSSNSHDTIPWIIEQKANRSPIIDTFFAEQSLSRDWQNAPRGNERIHSSIRRASATQKKCAPRRFRHDCRPCCLNDSVRRSSGEWPGTPRATITTFARANEPMLLSRANVPFPAFPRVVSRGPRRRRYIDLPPCDARPPHRCVLHLLVYNAKCFFSMSDR